MSGIGTWLVAALTSIVLLTIVGAVAWRRRRSADAGTVSAAWLMQNALAKDPHDGR